MRATRRQEPHLTAKLFGWALFLAWAAILWGVLTPAAAGLATLTGVIDSWDDAVNTTVALIAVSPLVVAARSCSSPQWRTTFWSPGRMRGEMLGDGLTLGQHERDLARR